MRRFVSLALQCALIAFAATAISCESCEGQGIPAETGESPWALETVATNPGTRSEGTSYYLTFRGARIPDVFEVLWADGAWYSFVTKSVLWGEDGYKPGKADLPPPGRAGRFSGDDAAKGWYESDRLKEGTPAHWCYAERGALKACIDPERLADFVEAHSLSPIPRFMP